jgi:phosphoketolase
MIANGRRIDQRTTMAQSGGTEWFEKHLALNSFDPVPFDGTDPAAFAWAILEMERREEAAALWWKRHGRPPYAIPLPHGIATAPKGFGFYGEGTNPAHNLPLPANPRTDAQSASLFNESARRLWLPPQELMKVTALYQRHASSGRPRERDHPLATRDVRLRSVPQMPERPVPADRRSAPRRKGTSPMAAIDEGFVRLVRENPQLRPRVGNPDEMRSNKLIRTLEALKFRVTDPEPGIPEAIDGAVITALNEEAVASAALGNKGGINLVATYEAFGAKMFGVLRQEVIFANHLTEAGRPPGWLSVPLILTSHTWENSKNEQSHQDPSLAESMLGEPAPFSRVLFAADHNVAAALIEGVFQTRGQIWSLVVPKGEALGDVFSLAEGRSLLAAGAAELEFAGHRRSEAQAVLSAAGAYQLREVLVASDRLRERDVPHRVVYLLEPGRFRAPRTDAEAEHRAAPALVESLYPAANPQRVFLVHTRPEPMLGILFPLATPQTAALGFISRGGTLSVDGLLFVNRSTWAHVLQVLARVQGVEERRYLTGEESEALAGRRSPMGPIVPAGRE